MNDVKITSCDCERAKERNRRTAKELKLAKYNETYVRVYMSVYEKTLFHDRLPPCIADEIAKKQAREEAKKKADRLFKLYMEASEVEAERAAI